MGKALRVQSVVYPTGKSSPISWFALTRLFDPRYDPAKWPEDRRIFEKRL